MQGSAAKTVLAASDDPACNDRRGVYVDPAGNASSTGGRTSRLIVDSLDVAKGR
jgi:hypothetical protein